MSGSTPGTMGRLGWWIPAALLALLVAGLAVLLIARSWLFSPDAIEHLAIANAWVHGAGFVDPVQWTYNFDAGIPRPAFAVRAAVLPMLLAIPLALGATIKIVVLLHLLWGSLVTGAIVPLARRMMSLPAAIAAAVLIGLSPAWLRIVRHLWTEATGVACFLGILATARGVARSPRGALVCSALTLIGWATRPNLGAMVLAVLVVVVWELGPREAFRRSGPWTYLLSFVAGLVLIHAGVIAATGHAPYAGYAGAFEVLSLKEATSFQKEYIGTWAFLQEHWAEVLTNMGLRASDLFDALFWKPHHNVAGWLALAGVPYALIAAGPAAFERRLCALAAIGYSLVVLGMHGDFDAIRYPIFVTIPSFLCSMALVDDGVRALGERTGRARLGWTPWLSLVLAVLLIAPTMARLTLPRAQVGLQKYRQRGFRTPFDIPVVVSRLCPRMPPEALVLTRDPWTVTMWCGNPALRVASDLFDDRWWPRFVREYQPRYIIAHAGHRVRWLRSSPLVELVETTGGRELYEVRAIEIDTRQWKPPPPPVCAGRGPECLRRLGR